MQIKLHNVRKMGRNLIIAYHGDNKPKNQPGLQKSEKKTKSAGRKLTAIGGNFEELIR